MKTCSTCKEVKELSQFSQQKSKKDGLRYYCKGCQASMQRDWKSTNYLKVKAKHLKYNYNMTIEQWNQMYKDQSGCCAICNDHQAILKKSLCVDHDHETGEIRGLLCDDCNSSLGKFKDSVEILDKASVYLKRSKIRVVE